MPGSYSDYTDPELIELLCISNNSSAFAEIYGRHGRGLIAEAIRKTGDRSTAEDIVQEIFVKFWLRRHKITIEKNLQAYPKGMLKYHIIDCFFAVKNSPVIPAASVLLLPDAPDHDYVTSNFLHTHYQQALTKLPEKCHQVFELSRKGTSIRDISQTLSISEKTVEVHIGKALRLLRKEIRVSEQ